MEPYPLALFAQQVLIRKIAGQNIPGTANQVMAIFCIASVVWKPPFLVWRLAGFSVILAGTI